MLPRLMGVASLRGRYLQSRVLVISPNPLPYLESFDVLEVVAFVPQELPLLRQKETLYTPLTLLLTLHLYGHLVLALELK